MKNSELRQLIREEIKKLTEHTPVPSYLIGDTAFMNKHGWSYYTPIPMAEFGSVTGISRKAAKAYTNANQNNYDRSYSYDEKLDAIQIYNPIDS